MRCSKDMLLMTVQKSISITIGGAGGSGGEGGGRSALRRPSRIAYRMGCKELPRVDPTTPIRIFRAARWAATAA